MKKRNTLDNQHKLGTATQKFAEKSYEKSVYILSHELGINPNDIGNAYNNKKGELVKVFEKHKNDKSLQNTFSNTANRSGVLASSAFSIALLSLFTSSSYKDSAIFEPLMVTSVILAPIAMAAKAGEIVIKKLTTNKSRKEIETEVNNHKLLELKLQSEKMQLPYKNP